MCMYVSYSVSIQISPNLFVSIHLYPVNQAINQSLYSQQFFIFPCNQVNYLGFKRRKRITKFLEFFPLFLVASFPPRPPPFCMKSSSSFALRRSPFSLKLKTRLSWETPTTQLPNFLSQGLLGIILKDCYIHIWPQEYSCNKICFPIIVIFRRPLEASVTVWLGFLNFV